MTVTKSQGCEKMNELVMNYLNAYTKIEKEQKETNCFVNDLPKKSYQSVEQNLILLKEFFLKNDAIYISKHPRFSPYPKHRHHFLELNYVLSGKSNQIINGKAETIYQGEILLLDRGSVHSLGRHEEGDLLINLIFPNDKMNIDWLSTINKENSILFNFLAETLATRSKKQYLIFHCGDNKHVQTTLEEIIETYFTEKNFANDIITMYIPILFTELIGNCSYDYCHEKKQTENNDIIIETLKLIESDYAHLSLADVAQKMSYNKNYLSNIIKQKTGATFSQLLTQQRMKQAKFMIEHTELTIGEIIDRIGLKNKSYFYNTFRKTYGFLPMEVRKQSAASGEFSVFSKK